MTSADTGDETVVGAAVSERDQPWTVAKGLPGAATIVLVHGTLDRSAGLTRLARRLEDGFYVVRYDRRGYGRSNELSGNRSVSANVEDLVQIIDGLSARGSTAIGLFGHSFGGNVCLAAAAHRPDLVRAVAVYESPLSWRTEWFAASGFAEPRELMSDPADAAERFMRRLVGDEVWERLPSATRAQRRAEGATMVEELADLRTVEPWRADQITARVLAIYGERGSEHHRRAMEIVADELDGGLAMVDNANHFGPNTQAEVVADLLRTFFDGALGR